MTSNVNDCKTSCCVFNYFTQTAYKPNPTRLWSRFNYVCPCPSGQIQCSTDFYKLNERRKAEILKYSSNASSTKTNNLTKAQRWALLNNVLTISSSNQSLSTIFLFDSELTFEISFVTYFFDNNGSTRKLPN